MPRSTKNGSDAHSVQEFRLLTVDDLAGMLQISVRGIWRQVSTGDLPKPIYIGRLARWRPSVIQDWLENSTR